MSILTEERIKQATLRYLKAYYKYRPRSGNTKAALDQQAAGGIIADGLVQFPKEDGRVFTATFEATSHLTKGEVVYKLQNLLRNWDAGAFALFLTAILFGLSHINEWITVHEHGTWIATGMLFLSFLIFFIPFRYSFRWIQRYYYIYAIEQFKHYHADEQWIAIGYDVFTRPDSKYLRELKRQCVKNGIGLVRIKADETAVLVITPARQEVFSGRRRLLEFVGQSKILNQQGQKLANRSREIWEKATGGLLKLDRFKRSYYNQMAIIGSALAVIAGIFYVEYQKTRVVYLDREDMLEMADSIRLSGENEPDYYLVDTPFIKDPFPIAELPPPVYPEEPEVKTKKEVESRIDVAPEEPNNTSQVALVPSGDTLVNVFDCSRFLNLDGINYLIVEGNYRNLTLAKERLKVFSPILEGGVIWMGCFDPGRRDYALFFGAIYDTRLEAGQEKETFEKRWNMESGAAAAFQIVSLNN
ncbi:MAG: hypothetical protein GYB31_19545 [Bacteroidetes bacterium]|nr:hypothetical protein [Bacteroidota bacterium]